VNFDLSDDQVELRQAVREFIGAELSIDQTRALWDEGTGCSEESWSKLTALGWQGLTVPEANGGSGLGVLELALVCEAMGTAVSTAPYWSTVALAIPLLRAVADDDQKARLLGGIAEGRSRVTVAVPEAEGAWAASSITSAGVSVGGSEAAPRLSGQKLFVPDAAHADTILVAVRQDDGLGVFEVDARAAGVEIRSMKTVDTSRNYCVVTFDDAPAAAVGDDALTDEAFDRVLDVARLTLAAELAGIAETALAMSVEYAGVREQFGRAIGSFQSIQHKCADMKVDLENTKSLVYFAAWAIDQEQPEAAMAAASAKAYASDACPKVVAEAIQVHGGIGFTWEHDLHMLFKRAKADEAMLGDAAQSREWIATRLLA
jgi:alkylation response protein AidB-like acyl-CoA dehydrogenase